MPPQRIEINSSKISELTSPTPVSPLRGGHKTTQMLIARYTGDGGGLTLHKTNPNSPQRAYQQPAVFSQMDQ